MLHRGTASEAGHLLACMVELKGKVASLQCGQFLSQVNLYFFCKTLFFSPSFILLGGEGYVLRLETNIQVNIYFNRLFFNQLVLTICQYRWPNTQK